MLTLLLLFPVQSVDPASVLNRFERFMARADPLYVTYAVKFNGERFGEATLQIDRPSNLRASLNTPRGKVAYVINERNALEINYTTKMYMQHPPMGGIYFPQYKIVNPLQYGISEALVVGRKEALTAPNGKLTLLRNVKVGPVLTDQVTSSANGADGSTTIRSNIDNKGRLVKFWMRIPTRTGTMEIEHLFNQYEIGKISQKDAFSTSLPLGFSPFSLARADFGLPQGDQVPDIQLRKVSGGPPVSLKSLFRGKNALVLLTDPEYPANAEMLRSTREVVKKIPNAELVVIGMRKDSASAKAVGGDNAYYDPSGLQLQKLAVPGAPTFYLFRSNGTLAQMFFGYDGKWEELQQGLDLLKK